MTTDAEDRSTWARKGRTIRRDELLRLIEENGGPEGLDLRGADFLGYGLFDKPRGNPIDLSREALTPLAEAYRQANGGSDPPWLHGGGGIRLRGAQLQGANLWEPQLQGADLSYAQLQGANLWEAELQGADLSYAQLQGAYLNGAQLQGAHLRGARLQGADLRHAQLQGLDMYEVESLEGAHWYGAFLDHTRMGRWNLADAVGEEIDAHQKKTHEAYDRAKEAYLLLKNNFNQVGRYEDASWAYVKERRMERMSYHWWWRKKRAATWGNPFHCFLFPSFKRRHWRRWFRTWRRWYWARPRTRTGLLRWVRNWAYEGLTGYGEEPLKAVRAGGVVVLLFAVAYWLLGAMGGHARPGWFTSWNPADIDWAGFIDSLVYSIATFATFNLARPDLNPTGRGIEIASSLEAILGISVLALVVFTVGNRMSRS